jgi:hypothetical protein
MRTDVFLLEFASQVALCGWEDQFAIGSKVAIAARLYLDKGGFPSATVTNLKCFKAMRRKF